MVTGLVWGLVLVAVLVGCAEVGYRFGARAAPRADEHLRSQTTTVQASTLGLFALFLAFVMSMSEGRFTARREIAVDEANAISTAYLRTEILPQREGGETRRLMREYVAARRAFHAAGPDDRKLGEATARAKELQLSIWAIGASVANQHPDWDVMALYLESLNLMFDLEAKRYAYLAARNPRTIHVVVLLVALIAVGATGFSCGLGRRRNFLSDVLLPALIALACLMVADLDRPRAGLIRPSDAPMRRLEEALSQPGRG